MLAADEPLIHWALASRVECGGVINYQAPPALLMTSMEQRR